MDTGVELLDSVGRSAGDGVQRLWIFGIFNPKAYVDYTYIEWQPCFVIVEVEVKDDVVKMSMPKYKQEMPPEGGYGPIDWARKMPKRLNGKTVF